MSVGCPSFGSFLGQARKEQEKVCLGGAFSFVTFLLAPKEK
jgi:hypothetical protein